MPKSRINKILTAVVVVALVAAISVLVFAYIPWGGDDNQAHPQQALTLIWGEETVNMTQDEFSQVATEITGTGGYRTSQPAVEGAGDYLGVSVHQILSSVFDLDVTKFSLKIIAGDTSRIYDYEEVIGNVFWYDEENLQKPAGFGGVEMVLIYSYEGQPLTNEAYMIGYLAESTPTPPITNSSYWLNDVRAIEVLV